MSEHTPGPWEARTGKVVSHFVAAVPHPSMGIVIAAMMHGGQAELPDEELAANARLMAAAPDLLDALQALIAATELDYRPGRHPRVRNTVDEARAIIAKATQGNPQ